jgi:hypothetical protein
LWLHVWPAATHAAGQVPPVQVPVQHAAPPVVHALPLATQVVTGHVPCVQFPVQQAAPVPEQVWPAATHALATQRPPVHVLPPQQAALPGASEQPAPSAIHCCVAVHVPRLHVVPEQHEAPPNEQLWPSWTHACAVSPFPWASCAVEESFPPPSGCKPAESSASVGAASEHAEARNAAVVAAARRTTPTR